MNQLNWTFSGLIIHMKSKETNKNKPNKFPLKSTPLKSKALSKLSKLSPKKFKK